MIRVPGAPDAMLDVYCVHKYIGTAHYSRVRGASILFNLLFVSFALMNYLYDQLFYRYKPYFL